MHISPPSFRAVVPALAALALIAAPVAKAESVGAQMNLPSLAPLVDSVKDAVVNVEVQSRAGGHGPSHMGEDEDEGGDQDEGDQDEGPQQAPQDPLHRFFGNPFGGPRERNPIREGLGSGFVIDPRGYILTNNHVVEGAIDIVVHFNDGRTLPATVLGRDPLTDIALIKLKGQVSNLKALKLGDSDALRVGDWLLAIGNPFGLASSVSLGILSAKARQITGGPYDDFLQTDAAINPGNSGGPLFNMQGEVIGINTAIVSGGTGIGFAVPSNLAKALIPQLEKSGSVTRGYLGVSIQKLTPELGKALNAPVSKGAIVSSITPKTPAAEAGLKDDDVITTLNGQKLESEAELSRRVSLMAPGTVVTLDGFRAGKPMQWKVKLGTRPDIEHIAEREHLGAGPEDRTNKQRIGLTFQDMDPRLAHAFGVPAEGALVTDVVPGSPADRSELSRGMVIIEANHQRVRNAQQLSKILQPLKSGSSILLRVEVPRVKGTILRALTIP
jgi:serine protease Do